MQLSNAGFLKTYVTFFSSAYGPARCTINNGGCWSKTKNGLTFSACSVSAFYPLIIFPGFQAFLIRFLPY